MESWEKRIERILDRAPTRAMALSQLVEAMRVQSSGPPGSPELILRRMKEDRERFKVVPDRLGPWSTPRSRPEAPGRRRGEGERDPWILIRTPPSHGTGPEGRIVGQVQESLQAWGQGLDTGSQWAVARWIDANFEAQETLSCLIKRPAPDF